MIVVDASAAFELLFRTARGARVEARLFASGQSMHAPHLLDIEVAQVLRRYALAGDLSATRGAQALADLADLPVRRYPHDFLLPRIWQLRAGVTAYDAAYLALAEVLSAPLVTCDARLARSRHHAAEVEVF